jgi:hypothetical protein
MFNDRREIGLVQLAFLAQAAVVPERAVAAEAAEGAGQRLQEPTGRDNPRSARGLASRRSSPCGKSMQICSKLMQNFIYLLLNC